jgi:hypothetical protein
MKEIPPPGEGIGERVWRLTPVRDRSGLAYQSMVEDYFTNL